MLRGFPSSLTPLGPTKVIALLIEVFSSSGSRSIEISSLLEPIFSDLAPFLNPFFDASTRISCPWERGLKVTRPSLLVVAKKPSLPAIDTVALYTGFPSASFTRTVSSAFPGPEVPIER